jgi:hypothetical protein
MAAGRTTIVALTAGLALLTAACGSTQQNNAGGGTSTTPPASSTSGGGADQNKVDFANDICDAIQEFITPATSFRPDTSSPAAAITSMRTQLGTMSTGLDKANQDLTDVKTDGVPDGKAAVTSLQQTFTELKTKVDNAKTKLDGVDVNNQQQIATAAQQVSQDLASIGNMQNPLDQPALKSPEMEAAAEQAPSCQKIKQQMGGALAGSTTATPPGTTR